MEETISGNTVSLFPYEAYVIIVKNPSCYVKSHIMDSIIKMGVAYMSGPCNTQKINVLKLSKNHFKYHYVYAGLW